MAKISNRDGFVLNEIKWDVQEIINHVRHEFDEDKIDEDQPLTPQVNDLFEQVDEVAIGRIIEELIETAQDEARTEGFNLGYEEGKNNGYDQGYDDGKDEGYNDGYEDAECNCE